VKKPKPKEFSLTAMTKGGAVSLFRFYEEKYGVKLISAPVQVTEGRWRVVMTDPFPEG
jgi:hypothetical protein